MRLISPPPPVIAAACLTACSLFTTPLDPVAFANAAEPPSAEAQLNLRKGYQAAGEGLLQNADALLSQSLSTWKQTKQPPDEISAIYKARATVREQQGRLADALADTDEAVTLILAPGATPDPAEIQRTYVLRARVNTALQRWAAAEADLTAAISRLDQLDAIEATNPFIFRQRSSARSHLGDYAGAAADAQTAVVEFGDLGDKVRRLLAMADLALALYGDEKSVPDAVGQMQYVQKAVWKKSPSTNNPDDIPLLQELARKEAELHLAYAAHLYGAEGDRPRAVAQWETGCIRLEAFVQDALQREDEERALRAAEGNSGPGASPLRASSVAGSPWNNDGGLAASIVGLDKDSPYITQRPGQSYFWYKVGEGATEVRDRGTSLATIDPSLSCAKFRERAWLRDNRPEWPPELVANAQKYAEAVPQGPIVVPPKRKSGDMDRAQCTLLLGSGSRGIGDAVPCF
jgi:tetratricopeptide (TPR) repeat protein